MTRELPAWLTTNCHLTARDADGDGLENSSDNCPLAANPGQEDGDGDGAGDQCDNCSQTRNQDQVLLAGSKPDGTDNVMLSQQSS